MAKGLGFRAQGFQNIVVRGLECVLAYLASLGSPNDVLVSPKTADNKGKVDRA